jgi:transcriptional regulator with XRE-family HTH domain
MIILQSNFHVGSYTVTVLDALAPAESEASIHEIDALLGSRIRRLRKTRGLSLAEVAARTAFSIGFLSQIERGLSSASVKVLATLADALGTSIASLFDESADEDKDQIVVRMADRKNLPFGRTGIFKQLLTPSSIEALLHLYVVVIEPEGYTGDDSYVHEGEEAGLVLEGSIELVVDDQRFTLNEGDSFRFSSKRPHRFRSVGRRSARVIWVNAKTAKAQEAGPKARRRQS